MSGLDDTTEPAAQDAGQAQNQNETVDHAALSDERIDGRAQPDDDLGTPSIGEAQTEEPVPAPEATAPVASPPEPAVVSESVAASEPVVLSEPINVTEPTPAVEPVVASDQGPVSEPAAPEQAATPVSEPVESSEPVATSVPTSAAELDAAPSAPEADQETTVVSPPGTQGPANQEEVVAPRSAAVSAETAAAPEQAPAPAATGTPETASATSESPAIGATAEGGAITPPPSGGARPKAATETGKIVEGIVTAVSAESVELTLDDGRPAVIHRRNFGLHDEEPSAVLSVGDRAFGAELAREDPKSRVVLSRAWALKRRAWERVVEAAADNQLLTGKVVSASKKGLVVDVGVRGFVPSSHLELTTVSDMSPYVDQTLELKILEVDPRREKLVLSRRSLLLKAQRKEMQALLGSLKPGEVRSGTVASIADYGVFVDLGGVSGLVHISELSWRRVSKPAEVVSVGDQVEVKVLDVKPKKKRISLSMRQITQDPLAAIEVGAVVTGPVTRLVDFGAFVAIGEFEGLVHLSELAEYRVSTPEEIVAPGDEVGVKILSVDLKRRRIELSIRRAAEYGG